MPRPPSTTCSFRYAELIDAGDFDGLAGLLGGAAIGSVTATGPTLTGHDAVLAMFTSTTRRYPDGTPGTKHVTTNSSSRSTRTDRGGRRSYFTVLQAVAASRCSRSWPAGTTTGSSAGRGLWHFPNAGT